jgi:hypothetical protein
MCEQRLSPWFGYCSRAESIEPGKIAPSLVRFGRMVRFLLTFHLIAVLLSVSPGRSGAADPGLRVRVLPISVATVGKPLRVLVGIRNRSGVRMLVARPETPGLPFHWFKYSVRATGGDAGSGVAGGVLKGSMHAWGGQVCPRVQDVVGIEPGAEVLWGAEIPLGEDLPAGRAVVSVNVTLASVRPDLECAPTATLQGRGSTSLTIRPRDVP